MATPSNTPATKMITVRARELRVHPYAQRRIVPAALNRLINELNLDAIGTFAAVRYRIDGVLATWIVDGQHRHAALLHHGFGDWEVDVKMHTDVRSDARAHRLFLDLNRRAPVSSYDTFLNELGEGDRVARGAAQIVERNGLKVARTNADGSVTCVSALKSLYAKDDGKALDKALATAIAAWGPTSQAVEGKIIEGLGVVFSHYNGEVDQPALVKKLAKYPGGAAGLHGSAKALKQVRSASLGRCVAEVVIETYNKGRRAGQLEVV